MLGRILRNQNAPASNRLLRRPIAWTVCFAWLVLLIPLNSAWATDLQQEAQIKAAYLLNFAKLVTWPDASAEDDESRFLVGMYGDPYLWKAGRRGLAGKKVGGDRVRVVSLSLEDVLAPDSDTKILFLSGLETDVLQAIIEALSDRPILLVSDHPDFCDLGGSIGLVHDDGRILFEINRTQELKSGLKINSRLLRIARRVVE